MSATVTPIDPRHRIDADEILERASVLDRLADLLDTNGFNDCRQFDPQLPSDLRDHADLLAQLAGRGSDDPAALVDGLAACERLAQLAGAGLARIGVRDMLGLRGYRRIETAVLSISELSSSMFDRSLDPALGYDLSAYDSGEMRRTIRAVAAGFSWSQQMADASVSLARPLARSLARHLAADSREPAEPLVPDRHWPTTDALLELHTMWLHTLDSPMRAELNLARSAHRNVACFDLGVACSIARRLLVHASSGSAGRPADTSHPRQWLQLLGPV